VETPLRPARGDTVPRREAPRFVTRPPAIRRPESGLRPAGAPEAPAEAEAPAAPKGYKYELRVTGEGDKWHQNAVVFPTREEAEKAGLAKFSAWTMAEDYRVVESGEEPNYNWDEESGSIKAHREEG
jgi:hypothetical protein